MFTYRQKHSKDYAKDRLKLMLLSERIACTPQLLMMMQNDIRQAVEKYVAVNENDMELVYVPERDSLEIHIPLTEEKGKNRRYAETV